MRYAMAYASAGTVPTRLACRPSRAKIDVGPNMMDNFSLSPPGDHNPGHYGPRRDHQGPWRRRYLAGDIEGQTVISASGTCSAPSPLRYKKLPLANLGQRVFQLLNP
jgi:hypothetical protein